MPGPLVASSRQRAARRPGWDPGLELLGPAFVSRAPTCESGRVVSGPVGGSRKKGGEPPISGRSWEGAGRARGEDPAHRGGRAREDGTATPRDAMPGMKEAEGSGRWAGRAVPIEQVGNALTRREAGICSRRALPRHVHGGRRGGITRRSCRTPRAAPGKPGRSGRWHAEAGRKDGPGVPFWGRRPLLSPPRSPSEDLYSRGRMCAVTASTPWKPWREARRGSVDPVMEEGHSPQRAS